MKSMEEYINDVYEKYEETEKNHKIYKTVRMKYHNPLTTLCSVAACLLLVCMFGVGINFLKTEEKLPNDYVEVEPNNDGTVVYSICMWIDNNFEKATKYMLNYASDIVVISNFNITYTDYEVKNGNFILKSNGDLEVNKILRAEKEIGKSTIKFSKYCGMVSLAELEKDKNYDWKTWELDNIGHLVPEEEKSITYFKQYPSKGEEIREDKQYLVFLEYDEENDIYNIIDYAYGILEYDPTTNKVKNIDTGEFEDFDWDLINEKMDEE